MERESARWYLAGMVDGEGWVGDYTGTTNRACRIANTDPDLIAATCEALDALGITYHVYAYKSRHERWMGQQTIVIYGRDNLEKLRTVPFFARRKRERLDKLVTTFQQPLDPAEVRAFYEAGLTRKEIAAKLGCGLKKVILTMQRNEIKGKDHQERAASIWRLRKERYGDAGRKVQVTSIPKDV